MDNLVYDDTVLLKMAADTFNNYTVSEDKFRTMVDFCNEDPGFPAYRGIVGPEEESRDRQAPCGSGCEAGGQGRGACSREQTPPRLRPRQEARHRGSDCILDKMVAAAPVESLGSATGKAGLGFPSFPGGSPTNSSATSNFEKL